MFARYASAITTGTLVTFGLLYAMQGLIHLQPGAESEPRPRMIVDWISLPRRPTSTPPASPEFDKDTLARVPVPPAGRPGSNTGTGFYIPVRAAAPTPLDTQSGQIREPDGPLLAIVRVQPTYPAVAAARGLEGWVDVRFDVMANGQVTNVVVTGSSSRVFERAAIRAAHKFRFRAPVVDGVPRMAIAVDYRFRFEMND